MTQFPGDDGSALSDLRIIDMATIVAGPAAAKYLGDYGADVIKVESPSGDSARRLGWALDDEDDSFFWKIIGRNKKCVAIDLKSEAGLKQMLQLIDSADVLIENFRPGTLERLGFGPEVLLERNPRLVVLRVTGFGQGGPYAGRPGFATVVEALTGYAALSGEPDGQPLLPPIAITDEISGLAGAFAVMTALWSRAAHGARPGCGRQPRRDAAPADGPSGAGLRSPGVRATSYGFEPSVDGAPGDLSMLGRAVGRYLCFG